MMKYNGGMATFVVTIPLYSAFLRVFDFLILAPANSNSPACLISIITPLLLNSMIIAAVFQTAKHTPATNRMGKFLMRRAERQEFNEAHHDTIFVGVVF